MPLPEHLNSGRAQGFLPGEIIAQYELGTMRNFIYLILDPATKSAAIVDPQKDGRPVADLEAHGYRLTSILLTHTHHDHVAGVPGILEQYPDLPVRVHAADAVRLKTVPEGNLRKITDGETFRVGEIEIEALHSPGHSPGEVCYVVRPPEGPRYLLSGDTLFIRDCGRTDFPDSDNDAMFKTLQRLKTLPDAFVMLPGHHYAPETASLLGNEKRESPPLLCASAEELARLP
jgi:glyoxylase-like metal-dependent hydrolase (beta-lactamase superfamily II)